MCVLFVSNKFVSILQYNFIFKFFPVTLKSAIPMFALDGDPWPFSLSEHNSIKMLKQIRSIVWFWHMDRVESEMDTIFISLAFSHPFPCVHSRATYALNMVAPRHLTTPLSMQQKDKVGRRWIQQLHLPTHGCLPGGKLFGWFSLQLRHYKRGDEKSGRDKPYTHKQRKWSEK